MSKRVRTDIPVCPHCGKREAWLAQGYWTCRRCAHTWARRVARRRSASQV